MPTSHPPFSAPEGLEPRCLLAADLVPVALLGRNLLVENRGDMISRDYDVKLFASVNQIIGDADDRVIRFLRGLPGLPAREDIWVGIGDPTEGLPEGHFYLGAAVDVDREVDESDETNNTLLRSERDTIGSPHPDIALSGKGAAIAPRDVSPSRVDGTEFGSFGRRTVSIERTFTITNTGTDVLEIGRVRMGGRSPRSYVITRAAPASLAPGATADVVIAFDPTGGGDRFARVIIESSDQDTPRFEFVVHGVGARPAVATVGREGSTVVVRNVGGHALEIVDVHVAQFAYVEFPGFAVRTVPLHRTNPASWTRILLAGRTARIAIGGYGMATAELLIRLGAGTTSYSVTLGA